ncbi:MAG: tetratricopeptide repeat protein [Planctomycetaceae bacterium]|jgi:DNA-directed RNA polymerase subunit alpha|nr:tetratricopeptide repeat protein [Planctomycetaceae bacterium]
MVTISPSIDLKQIVVSGSTFGPIEIDKLSSAINRDYTQFELLREAVVELESKSGEDTSPAGFVRLGVCQYLIGRFEDALQSLKKGDGGALAQFFTGKTLQALGDYEAAVKSFELSKKSGYNSETCTLSCAEAYRYLDRIEDSLRQLNNLSGAVEQTAEYLYQRGATVNKILGNEAEAIRLFERAYEADKSHPGALFGLALVNERHGNDEEALELYKRAVSRFPTNVGTLINLGILYEDFGMYEQAVVCFQRVLDSYPNHDKARLFLKDARASSEMHFDEDAQRKRDRMGQVLNLPVSDFEMSVRSRNCLKTMGINTLGDLCKRTEQELLGSKNFGETSLVEIREMLSMKGLQLGQLAAEKHAADVIEVEALPPEEQAVMMRPVTDLNLSVRARKCMSRLGIQTIAELVRHTPDELLESKNFGVTSLNEIREKLTLYNMKLRGE